jgi:hypothetical protein
MTNLVSSGKAGNIGAVCRRGVEVELLPELHVEGGEGECPRTLVLGPWHVGHRAPREVATAELGVTAAGTLGPRTRG